MNVLLTSIGRRGYLVNFFRQALCDEDRLIVANCSPNPPGEKHADASFHIPPAADESFGEALLSLAKEQKIDLLFSLHDWEISAIAELKDQLLNIGTRAVVPSPNAALICLDKYRTSTWAEENGIKTPKSWIDREQALEEGKFPFIVKPRFGQGSVGSFKVDCKQELDAAILLISKIAGNFPKIEGVDKNSAALLISEWIEGLEYGIDVVNDFEGGYAGVLARQKLLARSGETETAKSLEPHRFIPIARKISSALGHPGICDCDLIERDGELFLIELNPRFGGLYPFSHLAGANVPGFFINLAQGKAIPDFLDYKPDKVFVKHFSFFE